MRNSGIFAACICVIVVFMVWIVADAYKQKINAAYQRGLADCEKHNYNQAWEDGHLAGWRSAFAISRMSYDDSLAALRDSLEECRAYRVITETGQIDGSL